MLGPTKTPGSGGASALRRFKREAQATARLQSAHTVQIFDFGVTDEETFYYVMELLHGLDAQTLVERFGPIDVPRACYLLMQICESLAEAHDQGLIHRDVKPANVYICRQGRDFDFAKVLDFGLVKHVADDGSARTQLTGAGQVNGTPATMPPEVVVDGAELDARGDIYSLGCVAYWLVTGRDVFEGETPLAVVVKHVQETPLPPSKVSELAIPEAFDRLILACLRKDREARPQSMDEVHAELRRLFDDSWDNAGARHWWETHAPEAVLAES